MTKGDVSNLLGVKYHTFNRWEMEGKIDPMPEGYKKAKIEDMGEYIATIKVQIANMVRKTSGCQKGKRHATDWTLPTNITKGYDR